MVAADGGVFTFGDAPFLGSMGGHVLNDPVVGMAPSPHDGGYLLVATDGGIFGFGRTSFFGSLGGGYGGDPSDVPPVAGMALTPDAQGYWLLEPDGWSYAFTNPPSPSPSPTASAIVSVANSQVDSDPVRGQFCNPYGPCEEWCALFATWVWQQAGVPDPLVPLHRQHLRLGCHPYRRAPRRCRARPRRRRALRHRAGHRPPPRATSGWSSRSGRTERW